MKQNSTLKKNLAGKISIHAGLTLLMVMISMGLSAQAVKEYTSAEASTLQTDLAAGTYDIYELTTAGGDYTFTGTSNSMIVLNKNVTIRAKAGLATKPIISISGTSTSSTAGLLIPSVPSMILRLEGIEFEGINKAAGGVHQLVRSATGTGITATTASQDFQLIVRDCFFHGFGEASTNKGIFRMEGIGSSVDIQGCTFNNCVGRLICLQSVAVDPYILYGDIILKNNTFSNILNDGFSGNSIVTFRSASSSTQLAKGNNLTIDHCTFYNCKFLTGTDFIALRTMKGLVSITNCIFDQISNGFSFVNPDLTAPAMVIGYNYLAGFASPPSGTNTIATALPGYTNAGALNFGLTNVTGFTGSDAKTIGDTRYYGTPTSVKGPVQFSGNGKSSLRSYPNPASEKVTFDYTIDRSANVKISVYNLSNQLVKSYMNNEPHGAGSYSRSFDVSDLKTGVYYVRLTAGTTSKTVKILVK